MVVVVVCHYEDIARLLAPQAAGQADGMEGWEMKVTMQQWPGQAGTVISLHTATHCSSLQCHGRSLPATNLGPPPPLTVIREIIELNFGFISFQK